jgi:hypothetical protein
MTEKTFPDDYDELSALARALKLPVVDESELLENRLKWVYLDTLMQMLAYASKVRAVTASGTVTLADSDPIFIEIDPDGADRDVNCPAAGNDNHIYIVRHVGSANTLTVKRSGGTSVGTISAGTVVFLIPSAAEDFILLSFDVSGSGVFLSAVRVYTSSDTWSKPPDLYGVYCKVQAAGAGSGGMTGSASQCGIGGPGGGGEYAEGLILEASLGSTESVVVGAGGSAGSSGGDGGAGGDSSFGSHITCVGGSPGLGGSSSATVPALGIFGGAGGTGGSGGDWRKPGERGTPGIALATGAPGRIAPSKGGASHMGVQATVISDNNENGGPGKGYGGGASGGQTAGAVSRTGAAGAPGIVIVFEYTYGS